MGKVILVAPNLGHLTESDNFFGKFKIDSNLVDRTSGVTLFFSDNDDKEMLDATGEIKSIVKNLKVEEFYLGHFTSGSMKSTKFPELSVKCLN